jgi:hypothetical protein
MRNLGLMILASLLITPPVYADKDKKKKTPLEIAFEGCGSELIDIHENVASGVVGFSAAARAKLQRARIKTLEDLLDMDFDTAEAILIFEPKLYKEIFERLKALKLVDRWVGNPQKKNEFPAYVEELHIFWLRIDRETEEKLLGNGILSFGDLKRKTAREIREIGMPGDVYRKLIAQMALWEISFRTP